MPMLYDMGFKGIGLHANIKTECIVSFFIQHILGLSIAQVALNSLLGA